MLLTFGELDLTENRQIVINIYTEYRSSKQINPPWSGITIQAYCNWYNLLFNTLIDRVAKRDKEDILILPAVYSRYISELVHAMAPCVSFAFVYS